MTTWRRRYRGNQGVSKAPARQSTYISKSRVARTKTRFKSQTTSSSRRLRSCSPWRKSKSQTLHVDTKQWVFTRSTRPAPWLRTTRHRHLLYRLSSDTIYLNNSMPQSCGPAPHRAKGPPRWNEEEKRTLALSNSTVHHLTCRWSTRWLAALETAATSRAASPAGMQARQESKTTITSHPATVISRATSCAQKISIKRQLRLKWGANHSQIPDEPDHPPTVGPTFRLNFTIYLIN